MDLIHISKNKNNGHAVFQYSALFMKYIKIFLHVWLKSTITWLDIGVIRSV